MEYTVTAMQFAGARGSSWDLEVVAFHEAVPGHHLQLSRLQLLTHLPALQRQRSLTYPPKFHDHDEDHAQGRGIPAPAKLDARDRTQLVIIAYENGLVVPRQVS